MKLRSRLLHLLAGWGSVGLVYFSSDVLQGQGALLPETALDRAIPYNDAAIWLYLSFFILIPYAYLVADTVRVRWLARAMMISALICGLVFLLYPTTLAYPPVGNGSGWSTQALRWLQAADSTQNCLPSLHGALTLLCVWALYDRLRLLRSTLAALLGVAICYAIIALRRHLGIDLAAGLAVGLAGGMLANLQLSLSERRALSMKAAS
ncbi:MULTISPECIES: phosphatase PAP2 family protein [unclassified Janthinobacterium]|uniref:phosphatase PAP2 family protein n=1 Tax=unclassified Janthinobacterium TaxID=2610881 RepID=UPI0016175ED2|nr:MULTISPECIES: phosphatase PAP2 family protein [unclassified Janthinobacterium]MBB5367798.1 membrane-associated phospholipid phosphatase [Janthinobacterium sp. K2C7]MBB5379724.1 membrane-associated phospholipid phosphatase [Janthinobacterium sp. K2Li3]MBB5386180.1 membrane-associated phospholipid phosphatase [Janthinobacterium sp. K2E3]